MVSSLGIVMMVLCRYLVFGYLDPSGLDIDKGRGIDVDRNID